MFPKFVFQILLPVLIIASGVGGLMWLSARDTAPQRNVTTPTPPLLETVVLQSDVTDFEIRVNGNVVPRRKVTLSAEVSGAIISKDKSIESGRHVRKATPLLQIDSSLFELQVRALGSELEQVAVDLKKLAIEEKGVDALIELAEREAEIAINDSKRHQALALKKAVSEAELEEVERAELQARNILRVLLNRREIIPIRHDRLQAEMKLTQLKQKQAQLDVDHTRIVAPFSGVLASVMVEQGDYVETGDDLLELVDTSAIDVECSLQMGDLYWLWNSNTVDPARADPNDASNSQGSPEQGDGQTFEVPMVQAKVTGEVAGRAFHWNGRLARYGGRGVNRKTRTVLCRVTVDDPVRTVVGDGPPTLMRGMYVTVTLNIEPKIRLWRIPTLAVQPDGQVWTIEDGILRGHTIRPAKSLSEGVLVRADSTDLKPGDHVVVTQLVTPIDGSRVREIAKDQNPNQAKLRDGGGSR